MSEPLSRFVTVNKEDGSVVVRLTPEGVSAYARALRIVHRVAWHPHASRDDFYDYESLVSRLADELEAAILFAAESDGGR